MEKPERFPPEDLRFLKDSYWSGEEFREATASAAARTKAREGQSIPDEPGARIANYLGRFTSIFDREDEAQRQRGIAAIGRLLHSRFVIKPENISDEYIKGVLFGNFAERQGYDRQDLKDPSVKQGLLEQFRAETGRSFETYVVPAEEGRETRTMVAQDQAARLDSWFNYLTSDEASRNIPAAYRYWAMAEALKLGSYDDDRQAYNRRDSGTAAPFPELDQQALALVLDEIRKQRRGEASGLALTAEQDQAEFKKRLQSENFGKLYAFAQEHLKTLRLPTERLIVTAGEWRVFPQGSDPREVAKSLAGFHTQWCIAGEGTAAGYLAHSDLHVYFSKDQAGANSIPRACVVAAKERGITEVRGIMSDETAKQHLDDFITPVVEDRLDSLPGGEEWRAVMRDMKRLAAVHIKHLQREALTNDDLRFLYGLDGEIHSAGYDGDPRIAELLRGRDLKDDLSLALGLPRRQISVTREEALAGGIKYHYGSLDLRRLTSADGLKLPESIGGNLDLRRLTSADGLKLPESIGGNLDLRRLTSADGLKLPNSVGRDLYLGSLTSADNLKLPNSVGRDLYLGSLTSADNLKLPNSVGGNLYLNGLTSAEKSRLGRQYPHLRIV